MADSILSDLNLTPAEVPNLPTQQRRSLISYLIRWQHDEAARRCLQQLLVTHSRQVTVYDSLARVYLAQEKGDQALEIMRRRHALGTSNSSRALEARAHLATGDLAAAQDIATELTEGHPDLLTGWSLMADVRLALGDAEAAEAAIRQREVLRPDTAATAAHMARLWQSKGDDNRAILWARTALARASATSARPPCASCACWKASIAPPARRPRPGRRRTVWHCAANRNWRNYTGRWRGTLTTSRESRPKPNLPPPRPLPHRPRHPGSRCPRPPHQRPWPWPRIC